MSSCMASFCNQDGYNVVFEDNFDGTMLNTSRYGLTRSDRCLSLVFQIRQRSGQSQMQIQTRRYMHCLHNMRGSWTTTLGFNGGQGRDAFLLNKNVYVEDGNLVLRSMKDDYGFNYTSGAVTTQDKVTLPPAAAIPSS